jgi:hypothetical protein
MHGKHDVRTFTDLRWHDIDVDAEETALADRAHDDIHQRVVIAIRNGLHCVFTRSVRRL